MVYQTIQQTGKLIGEIGLTKWTILPGMLCNFKIIRAKEGGESFSDVARLSIHNRKQIAEVSHLIYVLSSFYNWTMAIGSTWYILAENISIA